MSVINRLGVLWGLMVLAFLCLMSSLEPGGPYLAADFAKIWAMLTLPPWLLLQGLAWVCRGIR